jgi:excisionase family DNA binding protein
MKKKERSNVNENGSIKVYSPKKIAEILDVKEAFVKRQLREGKMKGFKMGKFWRISEEGLDEFINASNGNGNGRSHMDEATKRKIQFHATLKSQNSIPKTIQNLAEAITETKNTLGKMKGPARIAKAAKLNALIRELVLRKDRMASMEDTLNGLGAEAYPEVAAVADKDAEALEQLFAEKAKQPKGSRTSLITNMGNEGIQNLLAKTSEESPAQDTLEAAAAK